MNATASKTHEQAQPMEKKSGQEQMRQEFHINKQEALPTEKKSEQMIQGLNKQQVQEQKLEKRLKEKLYGDNTGAEMLDIDNQLNPSAKNE